MKHYVLSFILCLLALNVSAKSNPVRFVQGDFSVLQNSANVVRVELDMSKAKLSDTGKSWSQFIKDGGADYVRDWPGEKKKLELYFAVMYNRKNKKGAKADQDAQKVDYTIVLRPGEIDLGSRAAAAVSMFVSSFVKGGECKMKSCEISVEKTVTTTTTTKVKGGKKGGKTQTSTKTSTKQVCTYTVGEMKGSSSMSETIRIGTILTSMGKHFGKLVAKQI